jgi:hypothetical protein
MDGEKLPNPSAHHDPQWAHEGDLNNAESSSANHTGTETPVYDGFLEKDSAFNNDDDNDHRLHNQVDIEDEKTQDAAPADETTADTQNEEYISGFKLYGVVLSVTLACFLILLDMSIIATVRNPSFFRHCRGNVALANEEIGFDRLSRGSRVNFIPFPMSVGTGVPINLLRKYCFHRWRH